MTTQPAVTEAAQALRLLELVHTHPDCACGIVQLFDIECSEDPPLDEIEINV